ncbi:hypothetical protein TNCV_1924491 [Trichonephila clavipes]|nr:hypothetical protein TNCV_1924491 [Trichonephila clavipes]
MGRSEEMLGPVDKRDVCYTTIRPRMPGKPNSREDRHIIRHARIVPTVALSAIHTQTSLSLQASESVCSIARRLAEKQLLAQRPLRVLPLSSTHSHLRLRWCRVQRRIQIQFRLG